MVLSQCENHESIAHHFSALMCMSLAQGFFGFIIFAGHVFPPPCCRLLPRPFPEVAVVMEDLSGQVDRLLADRQEMKRREASLKAQLKKAKGLREREKRAWRLSAFMLHVVLIANALCDYEAPAAMKFLTMTGRKRRWPEKPESELQELVENLFMECDTNELAELADKDNPTHPEAFVVAARYSEEWHMAAFVEDQNVRLGLAPSTESLLDRWRRRRTMYPEAFRPLDAGLVAEGKARKWAHRWRIRWGAWHGGIRVRDELPLEETKTKAYLQRGSRGPKRETKTVSHSEPVLGSPGGQM
jgi:hypothetical protein